LKVLFINNGTAHYYNLVLNKLNEVPGIDLTLIVPAKKSEDIGEGVYQTREGVHFKIIELDEYKIFGVFPSFRGLGRLFLRERPDIVITADTYIFAFLFDISVVAARKRFNIKLIMKSIPFRLPLYAEARRQAKDNTTGISVFPALLNALFMKLRVLTLLRTADLRLRKFAYNLTDAHVNYVDEAYAVYGSYGVPPDKIFITRNSPDTDALFAVRESLESADPILPPCEHRLIHVGRLVAWKRVDMLLRAFASVKKRYSGAELLIIGTGPEASKLKDLSAELNINNAVRFLGGVYDPQLLGGYFMSSTVYVLAGMGGLSINEAMCFGLPIICSVGDGTEKMLVRDGINGTYFKDGDENDLADKILYLLDHPEPRREMGIRSTEIIRDEINIHTVIDGYTKAFAFVLGNAIGMERGEYRE
jgi:glycosyltransferase involved in cell wall biosynthesis